MALLSCTNTSQLSNESPDYETLWFQLGYCGVDQLSEEPKYCNLNLLDGLIAKSIQNEMQVHVIVKGSALLSPSTARDFARREGGIVQDYLINSGIPRENVRFSILDTYVLTRDTLIDGHQFTQGTIINRKMVRTADSTLRFALDVFFVQTEIRIQ